MMKFELGKIVRWYFVLLFAGLIFIKCIAVYFVDRFDYGNPEDKIYNDYIEKLEGNITVKKEQYVLNEWKAICRITSQNKEMAEKYIRGEISRDEYSAYNDIYIYADSHFTAINKVMEDYRYIKLIYHKTHSRIKPEFIGSRYWNYYFNAASVDWVPILFIIVVSMFGASVEQTFGMWNIINSSYNGKSKILAVKMGTAALIGGVISFIFSTTEFLAYYKFFNISSFDAAIQSIHIFSNINNVVSIKMGVIVLILWRTIAGCAVATVTLLVSVLIKKDIISLFIMLTVMFGPVFLLDSIPAIFNMSFCGLYNCVTLILESASTRPLAVFSGWITMILIIILLYVLNMFKFTVAMGKNRTGVESFIAERIEQLVTK